MLLGIKHFSLEPISGIELFQPTQVISECTHLIRLRWSDNRITPASWMLWKSITKIPLAIVAGVRTVTPMSMEGIYVDAIVTITDGLHTEDVVVVSVTNTTFTATFVNAYEVNSTIIYQTLRYDIKETLNPEGMNREMCLFAVLRQ